MLNVSAYPLCAARLKFQHANLSDPLMTHYWAAVCVATEIRNAELAEYGGFNFNSRTEENGRALLSNLEKLLAKRMKRTVANAGYAHSGLTAMLGARGVKTSMLKTEDDFWTASETLFPGKIKRNGGMSSLYVQINRMTKKQRQTLGDANLRNLPVEWISSAPKHQSKLAAGAQ